MTKFEFVCWTKKLSFYSTKAVKLIQKIKVTNFYNSPKYGQNDLKLKLWLDHKHDEKGFFRILNILENFKSTVIFTSIKNFNKNH